MGLRDWGQPNDSRQSNKEGAAVSRRLALSRDHLQQAKGGRSAIVQRRRSAGPTGGVQQPEFGVSSACVAGTTVAARFSDASGRILQFGNGPGQPIALRREKASPLICFSPTIPGYCDSPLRIRFIHPSFPHCLSLNASRTPSSAIEPAQRSSEERFLVRETNTCSTHQAGPNQRMAFAF